ncbi:beta-galactosidase [Glycomyces sp. NPDC047010]|uniref:beta-galactosidase n=1 Tax=Glycomyces sp. NPDC047010 TaxID=3155023 RepID=UPI0033F4DADB
MTRSIRVPAPPPPTRGHLPFGGGDIEVTSRWIERGGRPWIPRTGEIHYSRLPRERWSETLGHARAGGLDSVATYVFWAAHEPEPGRFDWTGNLDLRAFVELAAGHGLDVVIRLGPWAHGEYRNGGFPDWLLERDLKARTDDPAYLALVRALYAETIGQLRGLTHAEGGPIIAAQVDNELYDQPGHLATLRVMAEELGLRVPIWTATGWGGAQVPDTLLPVFGAYADGFWEEATTEWPAFAPVHFRYSTTRDDLTVGADLREALDGVAAGPAADRDDVPFVTCELGGGMHVAYHRRPLVEPEDVAAVALAKLGSGSAWQGYYMYAGGTQRTGPQGTEQESQATGYPNDVPLLTYDFHAPIGEHGQIRPHHHLLRRQHLWLDADGHRLARMAPHIGDDPGGLRWSVRSDGTSGYLFATTYQPRHHRLPAQPGVQFTVHFDDATITVPTTPIDLPADRSLAWPLRYPLTDALELRSATAQLLTRFPLTNPAASGGGTAEGGTYAATVPATTDIPAGTGGGPPALDAPDVSVGARDLVVFAAIDGVPVELVLGDGTPVELPGSPGPDCFIDLDGVRLLVLDEASANRLYRLRLAGRDRLVLADAPVYADGNDLVVHSDRERVNLAILYGPDGSWRAYALMVPGAGSEPLLADLRPGHGPAAVPRCGGPMGRLSAPEDYSGAAVVHVELPEPSADRTLLRIEWTGDVARAYSGGRLVGDHFWHGRPWDIDVTSLGSVRLEFLPWVRSTGVWVDPALRRREDGVAVESVTAIRVKETRLTIEEDS